MKIIDCIQGSDEWYQVRLGFVTASNFHKVLNKRTGRGLYMRKIAAERLTGIKEEEYKNQFMDNGKETEAEAREVYQMIIDCNVEQVGFVQRNNDVGGSPDGLVGTCGIIEIKCPISSTHIEYIINDIMPTEYIPQVQGLLWITERQWCDFISYDPRIVSHPLHIIRIHRDVEYQKELEGKINIFVKELKAMVKTINDGSF